MRARKERTVLRRAMEPHEHPPVETKRWNAITDALLDAGCGRMNVLAELLEGRAFVATSLPPGNSASGFFYFQTGLRPDATIYISGIREAATGNELLYFEVPLVTQSDAGKPQPPK